MFVSFLTTVAWYTTLDVKHFPDSGHEDLFLQLHSLGFVLHAVDAFVEIFKKRSPLDKRRKYSDVILLITDGKPEKYWKKIAEGRIKKVDEKVVRKKSIRMAKELMDNYGVEIVGLWVGDADRKEKKANIDTLRNMSSPGKVFNATFENIDTVIQSLVNGSCQRVEKQHECSCPATGLRDFFIEPGSSTRKVSWNIPEPECEGTLIPTSPPNAESGNSFPIGPHKITYTYIHRHNRVISTVTCDVTFKVKVCPCPPAVNINVQAAYGDTSAVVTWNEPRPSCNERVTDIHVLPENYQSGQSIPIGQHVVRYTYEIDAQFTLTCDVNIDVRVGHLCKEEDFNPLTQECCCGAIHNTIPGYECCGQYYFSSEVKQCCYNSVVWEKELSCPR